MISSGEIPDAGWHYADATDYYEKGITRSIPRSYIEENMPRYTALLEADPVGWNMNLTSDKEDEYMGITGYIRIINKGYYMSFLPEFRLDWLENVGFDLSSIEMTDIYDDRVFITEDGFTLDQLNEIFRLFTTADPDGNGKDDTTGLVACSNKFDYFTTNLWSIFGIGKDMSVEAADGTAIPECISEGYKQMLMQYNEWYELGYMNKDVATTEDKTMWDMLQAGIGGYCESPYGYVSEASSTAWPFNVIENTEEAKLLITGPFVASDGSRYYKGDDALGPWRTNYTFVVSASVDDAKLARILAIVDYVNIDEEGMVLSRYGVEGVDFEWEGEPYASRVDRSIAESTLNGIKGFYFYNMVLYTDFFYSTRNPEITTTIEDYIVKAGDDAIMSYKKDFFNTTEISDVESNYGTDMDTVESEFLWKALTGEIDIEAEWDSYVANWKAAGGDMYIEELNKGMTREEALP
jgi:hypothetical protein